MDIKQAAQEIRDTVDMDQILSLYGYRRDRNGFMCCPFHGERAPSLKVYRGTGGWHCFGCGRGGSVIDFVMEQEGCAFTVAVRAIDQALNLGLMDFHENPEDAAGKRLVMKAFDNVAEAMNDYIDKCVVCIEEEQTRLLLRVKDLEEKRYNDPESLTKEEWNVILSWKDEDDYFEYRKDKYNELKEEVAAWLRKARRTG